MTTDLEREMKGGRRRMLRATLLLATLGVALVAAVYGVLRGVWGVGPIARPFDREAWTAPDRQPGDRLDRRARMVSNLVKRRLQVGMTRAEVEALLGPPDPDPLLAPSEEGEWIYLLGSTFLGKLRIVAWAFDDTDVDSPDAFEGASEAFEIRALRLGFDADERLERIEIDSM
jgi:hypothetical protein